MKRLNTLLLFPVIWLFVQACPALSKGHLVIIGGGKRPAYIMEKFVSLAGGPESKILVIPVASSVPLEVALFQKYQLEKSGAGSVNFVIFSRQTADEDTTLSGLEGVTGIFFSGGDQRRLAEAMVGTLFMEKVKAIYRNGGVIAGTSAGAAVMSELMITGDEQKYNEEDDAFFTIEKKNVIVKEGFGFITSAIIDQHFIRRKRHNRLISLILEHPLLLGIGIDESTAVIVGPDDSFRVMGENTVIVYDATDAQHISTDKNGNLSARNIKMHLLRSGQEFKLPENNPR